MLTIRMQRTGRKGHAQFRVVAQDKRYSPSSGRVAANLGSYDPHTKAAQLDAEKIAHYLDNGAQPSPRVVRLLKAEGIKLPKWVAEPTQKQKSTRNPEKLRKNRPIEPKEEAPAEPTAEDAPADEAPAAENSEPEQVEESPAEPPAEPATEAPAEEAAPADEPKTEEPAEAADDQPAEG